MTETRPYGSWTSSLSADILAQASNRLGHLSIDQSNIYWLESRASEKGRNVLLRCDTQGEIHQVLPTSVNVRSKVHEYGSGDFLVDLDIVYFVNAKDQAVYSFDGSLTQLTQVTPGKEQRFADFRLSRDKRYLVCIRETHEQSQVINQLVCIDLKTPHSTASQSALTENSKQFCDIHVLHSGFDFYSGPRITPLGNRICWTCWNQPDMPWDAAELWVADFSEGTISAEHRVCGGHLEQQLESIYQPEWSKDGVLHYISDKSGWGNIYSCRDGLLNALTPIDRDFSIPQWILASSTYAIHDDNIYAVYTELGVQHLCHIDVSSGQVEPIKLPFDYFSEYLLYSEGYLIFRAASPQTEEAVYKFNIETCQLTQLSKIKQPALPPAEISCAESIVFDSAGERKCQAFYYPPKNGNYQAAPSQLPPLIVMSHGGPTAMTNNSLNFAIQFWTHRGFSVVDVNYAGSSGFGKKYRNLLNGQWGVADIEDCIAAAQFLIDTKRADKEAILIRGGSAGGYTTLCGLTFFDFFAAGTSRYGVADLECLASDSHKFEAHYLDSLVGPYPQQKQLYQARSPIYHTEKLSCPILLLQGADDKVVPPNQAEMMVTALKNKQIPFAYKLYSGEGHGFRKAQSITDALNSELSFYRQVLSIDSDELIPKLAINYLE